LGRLIADGQELDLGRDSIIALNFVIKDFREPEKVKGGFSKSIKLPPTKNNQTILGTPEPTDSTLKGQNELLQCEYIGDSGVTQFSGFLEVRERSRKTYLCVLLGENISWSMGFKGKGLRDLKMGVEDFSTAEVLAGRDVTAADRNTCYPIIDYGRFNTGTVQTGTNQFKPAVFVANVIKQMFNDQGYTVKIKGKIATFWDKLILPFVSSGDVPPSEDVLFGNSATVAKFISPQPMSSPTDTQVINFNVESSDPNNNFDLVTDTYTVPFDTSKYNIFIQNFRFTFDPNTSLSQSSSGYVQLAVMVNGLTRATRSIYAGVGATEAIFSEDAFRVMAENNPLEAGDVVQIEARLRPNPFTGDALTGVTLEAQGQFRMTLLSTLFQVGMSFEAGESLPDLTQVELLQDLIRRFNLVIQTDEQSKEVIFQWYEDWRRPIEEAIDWSDKLVNSSMQMVKLKELGGQLDFKQTVDANDSLELDFLETAGTHRGDTTIILEDEYDNKVRDISIPTAPTMMGYRFNSEVYIPIMIREDQPNLGSVSFDLQPRMLIFEGLRGGTFKFFDDETSVLVTETEYPFAYSILEDVDSFNFSMYFGSQRGEGGLDQDAGLVDTFYTDTIRMWNENKLLKGSFYLNEVDIAQLDLSVPIIIYESHYMINKIQDWQGLNKAVRVELLKLP